MSMFGVMHGLAVRVKIQGQVKHAVEKAYGGNEQKLELI